MRKRFEHFEQSLFRSQTTHRSSRLLPCQNVCIITMTISLTCWLPFVAVAIATIAGSEAAASTPKASLPNQLEMDPVLRAEPYIRSCMREMPIASDQLDRLKYSDFSDGQLPHLQCIVRCYMNRAELYDTDGRLNGDRAARAWSYGYQTAYASTVMSVCKFVRGTDECDTAYQVFKCFKQAIVGYGAELGGF